jgi:hypothetical protein
MVSGLWTLVSGLWSLVFGIWNMTRHALENGIMLCKHCHDWAGAKHDEFMTWLENNRHDQYVWVLAHKWQTGKPDYDSAIQRLKNA